MTQDYSLNELELETRMGGRGIVTQTRKIPVISLANFEARKLDIAEQLWAAATEIGFFQIADHGIAQSDLDEMFAWAKSFFSLPQSLKEKYPLKANGLNAGWECKDQIRPSTKTPDQKESYQVTKPHMDGVWPQETVLTGFKEFVEAFESQCWQLGMKVLSCFALKMGFEEHFFSQVHDPQGEGYQSTLRMLHYLPVSKTDIGSNIWRAGAHTDFDCLTLLLQRSGQGGLQVCPGKDADSGQWTAVEASDNLITCNIGDMLMRWSDDRLKSTLHRVAMPSDEKSGSRYSVAFFCQANKPAVIQGVEERYDPITAEEYLKQRIAANFAY